MKKFLAEFKAFAIRGNVMDLAVGVIIGAAFKSVVDSLVKDIISPIIGLFFKADFSNLAIKVPNTEVVISYGSFIMTVVNFLIMAFIIFCIIKALNKLVSFTKKEEPEEEPTTKSCPLCCSEIAIGAKKCPNCTSDLE